MEKQTDADKLQAIGDSGKFDDDDAAAADAAAAADDAADAARYELRDSLIVRMREICAIR